MKMNKSFALTLNALLLVVSIGDLPAADKKIITPQDAFSYWRKVDQKIQNSKGPSAPVSQVIIPPAPQEPPPENCPIIPTTLNVDSFLKAPLKVLAHNFYQQSLEKRYKVLNELCTTEMIFFNNMDFLLTRIDRYPTLFDAENPFFIGDPEMAEIKDLIKNIRNSSLQYVKNIHKVIGLRGIHHYTQLDPPAGYVGNLAKFIVKSGLFNQRIEALAKGEDGPLYKKFLSDFSLRPLPDISYHRKGKRPGLNRCFAHGALKNHPGRGKPILNSNSFQTFNALAINPIQRGPRLVLLIEEVLKSYPSRDNIARLARDHWKVSEQEADFIRKMLEEKIYYHPQDVSAVHQSLSGQLANLNEAKRQFEFQAALREFPFLGNMNEDERKDFFSYNTPEDLKKEYFQKLQLAAIFGVKYNNLNVDQKNQLAGLARKRKTKLVREFFFDLLKNNPDLSATDAYKALSPQAKADFTNLKKTPTRVLPSSLPKVEGRPQEKFYEKAKEVW